MHDEAVDTDFGAVPSKLIKRSQEKHSKKHQSKSKPVKDLELTKNNGRIIDDERTPLQSILENVKQVVLDTNILKLRCSGSSFETIVSKSVGDHRNEHDQLFKSKSLNENHIELEGSSSKKDEAILQYTYSIISNNADKELLVDVLSYPNITHSRWEVLGKVKLNISGNSSGHIEVINSYGLKIYQISELQTLNKENVNFIKKVCIKKSFEIGLNILNRDRLKVGKVILLGDVNNGNASIKVDKMSKDRYQSRITFPVEEDCVHKEEHKALLLVIPAICRWYFKRKQFCKISHKMI